MSNHVCCLSLLFLTKSPTTISISMFVQTKDYSLYIKQKKKKKVKR